MWGLQRWSRGTIVSMHAFLLNTEIIIFNEHEEMSGGRSSFERTKQTTEGELHYRHILIMFSSFFKWTISLSLSLSGDLNKYDNDAICGECNNWTHTSRVIVSRISAQRHWLIHQPHNANWAITFLLIHSFGHWFALHRNPFSLIIYCPLFDIN